MYKPTSDMNQSSRALRRIQNVLSNPKSDEKNLPRLVGMGIVFAHKSQWSEL